MTSLLTVAEMRADNERLAALNLDLTESLARRGRELLDDRARLDAAEAALRRFARLLSVEGSDADTIAGLVVRIEAAVLKLRQSGEGLVGQSHQIDAQIHVESEDQSRCSGK